MRARVAWNGQAARVDAVETAREGDRWDCGNGHLRADAALRLIVRNHVSDVRAMEWIDGAIDEAGPAFAQEMSAALHFDDVPF